MRLTVARALATPVLRDARLVAGAAAAGAREVRWTAVIEWPVEDFVRPGELVLTTALGCDAERFARLVAEIADAGAAALCVALPRGGPLREIPPRVLADADARGFPLVALPWGVRFAEVMLALADELIGARYASALEAADEPLGGFAGALLGGSGTSAVAAALEEMLERPVLVLDAALRVLAHGPRAATALAPALAAAHAGAALALDGATLARLRRELETTEPQRVGATPELALPPGTVVAAAARRRALGYVFAADGEGPSAPPALERRALAHAATAVAMELLRLRAVAESEARVRGDFLWGLARGVAGGPEQVAANAVLLGYDLRAPQRVALARASAAGAPDAEERARRAEMVGRALRELAPRSATVTRQGEWVLLLHRGDERALLPLLERVQARHAPERRPSWGIAEEPVTLTRLADGHRRALRALDVGEAVHGPGAVGEPRALGTYLLLDTLAREPDAVAAARAALAPLLAHDRASGRELTRTLEVYLRENGNASAAARALHLNRRSLTHRLSRIAQLTGRSLERHDDRFALDLSIALLRLAAAHERSSTSGHGSASDAPTLPVDRAAERS